MVDDDEGKDDDGDDIFDMEEDDVDNIDELLHREHAGSQCCQWLVGTF